MLPCNALNRRQSLSPRVRAHSQWEIFKFSCNNLIGWASYFCFAKRGIRFLNEYAVRRRKINILEENWKSTCSRIHQLSLSLSVSFSLASSYFLSGCLCSSHSTSIQLPRAWVMRVRKAIRIWEALMLDVDCVWVCCRFFFGILEVARFDSIWKFTNFGLLIEWKVNFLG